MDADSDGDVRFCDLYHICFNIQLCGPQILNLVSEELVVATPMVMSASADRGHTEAGGGGRSRTKYEGQDDYNSTRTGRS